MHSVPTAYMRQQVESVLIHHRYIEEKEFIRRWQYGRLRSDNDLALVTFKSAQQISHTCPIAEDLPSDNLSLRVKTYQYPSGHPLQKNVRRIS